MGSPAIITNADGYFIQQLSYDAWGNRRDPLTWESLSSNTTLPEPLIDRGFTFHEHLYPFTLINMNGRVYDPLVGRFLSPDNYMQQLDNSQSFNRYSYCKNSPLVYVDPDGQHPIIIAMAFSALLNMAIQGASGNLHSAGDYFMAAGIGAISGAAGGIAGQAIAGVLGTAVSFGGSVVNGALIGASGGFVGGVIGGSGNAWMNGSNFGQGLISGIGAGGIGVLGGLLVGGITGGLQYQRDWSLFRKGCLELGVSEEGSVSATDKFLSDAQKAWFKGAPMENVKEFTVENVPEKHLTGKYGLVTNNACAKTLPLGVGDEFSGRSVVYFNKDLAFSSAKQLFLTMGHELVHVSQFAAMANEPISLMNDLDFKAITEFHAYSYQNSLGGLELNSFPRDVVTSLAAKFPLYFDCLNYSNFKWTSTASFVYPF